MFAGLRSRLDLIMTTRDRGLQDGCDVACISIDNTPLFHVPSVPRCRRGAVVSAVVIIACYYTPLMRSSPRTAGQCRGETSGNFNTTLNDMNGIGESTSVFL